MEEFDYAVTMVDAIVHNRRKRHLVGGLLLSLSLFFAGLTVTIITLKNEEE